MNGDTPEVFGSGPLTKEEQERIDRAVPQMLQQIDPKVLIQFLKASDGNANINIITVGKYYAGSETKVKSEEEKKLQQEVEELRSQLREARKFSLLGWIETLPQPRHEYMMRELMLALRDRFETNRECAEHIGATPRMFSYWMKSFRIPGYKPQKKKGKGEE